MTAPGFFAVLPSGYVPSASYYAPYVLTAVDGGWNSGMLNTSDGTVTIPESGIYQINASFSVEYDHLAYPSYTIDLILEIDGSESRMRCQQTIVNNDMNTVVIGGALSLSAGQVLRVKVKTQIFAATQVSTSSFRGSYFSMVKI